MTRLSGRLAPTRRWVLDALTPALGSPLEVEVLRVEPWRRRLGAGDQVQAVSLEHADSSVRAMLVVDAPLAVDLAGRCVTGEHEPSMAAPRALDRVEQGALLYLAAQTVWACWGRDGPLRVAGLIPAEELESLDQGVVRVHLALRAGACAGHAWLHLPPAVSRILPGDPAGIGLDGDSRLENIPAAVHVVLGRSRISLAELLGASVGDALRFDEIWARPEGDGTFRGRLRLRLAGGGPRWTATLRQDGTLSLDEIIPSNHEGTPMDQADDTLPRNPGELLQEIPVEVSVELGRIALNAHQAISLSPGRILRLDRRPGDPVELRVGPRLVARGELVEVDGDLAVLLHEVYDRKGS